MAAIWFRCAETGEEASTGIETDAKGFGALPDKIEGAICPVCGLQHPWLKADAWLDTRGVESTGKAG